jgi:hypothetical protein
MSNEQKESASNSPSKPTTSSTSWPGILYYTQESDLVRCEELTGKNFYCLSAEGDKVLSSCRDGSFLVMMSNETQSFSNDPFIDVRSGKGFLVGVGTNNKLYTWGVSGDQGQLGHGASLKKVFEPLQVQYNAEFQSVSCGEAFSVALDTQGFAYAWGEVSLVLFLRVGLFLHIRFYS